MLTKSDLHLRLRFLRFVRSELLNISNAPRLFRHDHWRLTKMIRSMYLSGYLTRDQAAALSRAADKSLAKALASTALPYCDQDLND